MIASSTPILGGKIRKLQRVHGWAHSIKRVSLWSFAWTPCSLPGIILVLCRFFGPDFVQPLRDGVYVWVKSSETSGILTNADFVLIVSLCVCVYLYVQVKFSQSSGGLTNTGFVLIIYHCVCLYEWCLFKSAESSQTLVLSWLCVCMCVCMYRQSRGNPVESSQTLVLSWLCGSLCMCMGDV